MTTFAPALFVLGGEKLCLWPLPASTSGAARNHEDDASSTSGSFDYQPLSSAESSACARVSSVDVQRLLRQLAGESWRATAFLYTAGLTAYISEVFGRCVLSLDPTTHPYLRVQSAAGPSFRAMLYGSVVVSGGQYLVSRTYAALRGKALKFSYHPPFEIVRSGLSAAVGAVVYNLLNGTRMSFLNQSSNATLGAAVMGCMAYMAQLSADKLSKLRRTAEAGAVASNAAHLAIELASPTSGLERV